MTAKNAFTSQYIKEATLRCQTAGESPSFRKLNAKYMKVVLHYALPHAVVAKCIQIMKY